MVDFWPQFPASDCVDAYVCSSDVSRPKPDGESARLACERLGVRPQRAVMIGDSVFDIQCARAAGVAAIAVSYGSTNLSTLREAMPDAVFETPDALLEWVQSSISNQYETKEDQFAGRTR